MFQRIKEYFRPTCFICKERIRGNYDIIKFKHDEGISTLKVCRTCTQDVEERANEFRKYLLKDKK